MAGETESEGSVSGGEEGEEKDDASRLPNVPSNHITMYQALQASGKPAVSPLCPIKLSYSS